MLDADNFLVRERVKVFATAQSYDIFDARTQEPLGTAEEKVGGFVRVLRWLVSKRLMPTVVEVRDAAGAPVFSVRRGGFVFGVKVEVLDADGKRLGYFRNKLFSFGGGLWVHDDADKPFARVNGNPFGSDYKVLTPDGKVQLGRVSKKWEGVMRELFTSADTYLVAVDEDLRDQPVAKILVLASALAIDVLYKSEKKKGGVLR